MIRGSATYSFTYPLDIGYTVMIGEGYGAHPKSSFQAPVATVPSGAVPQHPSFAATEVVGKNMAEIRCG